MDTDKALEIVRSRAKGRTRYAGQEPFVDEMLAAEIDRLRHSVRDFAGQTSRQAARIKELEAAIGKVADELSQHVDEQFPEASLGWCLETLRSLLPAPSC